MGDQKRWIDEQKENRMFMQKTGNEHESERMLQHGTTNRHLSVKEGYMFTLARLCGICLIGSQNNCLSDLANELERVQMNIDKDSRKDFKEIAIEQWRGKIQALKSKAVQDMML